MSSAPIKNYSKKDYDLFFLLVQIDPSSTLAQRPSHISEEMWNCVVYTTIVVGNETRRVLATIPCALSQVAGVRWDAPAVQMAFINEKINSQKKIFLQNGG